MQITTGLISVNPVSDATLVTGNASVDWTQVTTQCLFIVSGVVYSITNVDAGAKTLRISPNWVGNAVSDVTYVIVRDFTAQLKLPLVNDGDLEVPALIRRMAAILDAAMQPITTDPAVLDIAVTATGHGFVVGNAVRRTNSGSGWTLSLSSSDANAVVTGIVSQVVDANTFWLRTTGLIGSDLNPIAGSLNPSAGQLLYLRAAAASGINICTGNPADTGSLKVPVMVANSASSAYVLSLARAVSDVFSQNTAGLVPAPTTASGRVLRDTGWSDTAVPNSVVQAKHLDATIPWVSGLASQSDWDAFVARSGVTPVHAYIRDLQTRLQILETAFSSGGNYQRYVFTRASHQSGTWSWNVPAGVSWCRITLSSASIMRVVLTSPRGSGSPTEVFQNAGKVSPGSGVTFRLSLEGVTSLSGSLVDYCNRLKWNSVNSVGFAGYDDLLTTYPALPTTLPHAPTGGGAVLVKRLVGDLESIGSSLTFDYVVNTQGANRPPFRLDVPVSTRPLSAPYVYATDIETREEIDLLNVYFPGQQSIPDGTPRASSGYAAIYGFGNSQYHFLGPCVIIETGIAN